MNTEICSLAVLYGLLAADPGRYDLLLITNPDIEPPEGLLPLARRALHLQFDDYTSARAGVRLPTPDDVRQALEWAADGDLAVACHAGMSRSAALAYVIRCRDWSPDRAIQILTRDWHRPNELIVRLGAELLRSPGVYETYLTWMGGRPRTR